MFHQVLDKHGIILAITAMYITDTCMHFGPILNHIHSWLVLYMYVGHSHLIQFPKVHGAVYVFSLVLFISFGLVVVMFYPYLHRSPTLQWHVACILGLVVVMFFPYLCTGHPSCLDMNQQLVAVIQSYPWQCMECKTCVICRDPFDEVGNWSFMTTIRIWRRACWLSIPTLSVVK